MSRSRRSALRRYVVCLVLVQGMDPAERQGYERGYVGDVEVNGLQLYFKVQGEALRVIWLTLNPVGAVAGQQLTTLGAA
ncbi:hypothetical protein [Deinococcus hopiensis]|uniref:Uncharacterized protein n=1 Tax=Deinococcus hopiensis KR-140 TaxID=695939 RepID=A0A1W1VW43_9DEIO|nr:hypothetical protein [Deinococcus hopiensis]SMB97589.1 hypothetical protein SAMN00790413_06073 [Deinococcus hopiensis KR-140]